MFVNKIVKIVHEVTKKWDGQPTKNLGEKYLLTWKLPTLKEKKKKTLADFNNPGYNEDGPNA